MIDVHAPVTPPGQVERQRWRRVFLVVALIAFIGGAVLGGARLMSNAGAREEPAPAVPPAPRPGSAQDTSAGLAPGVLRLAGRVPVRASGTFTYAPGSGRVLGRAGPLRRFHVAVERGSGEDVRAFAAQVEATLGDPRGWVGAGRVRFQRVSPAAPVDFTVFLATRYEAGRMCARGGVNLTFGRVPYTSCRVAGQVIVNLDRWRLSAPPYLAAKVPLATYRQYVINHEVGHQLGYQHEGCPRRGGPAPVMVQQTLDLRGCVPNPWPRVRNRTLAGPLL